MGSGTKVDLIPYIKECIDRRTSEKNGVNDTEIYVGSDSQNSGSTTTYGVVIVLHYGNSGGHVLYSKNKVDRVKDGFTRLWNEVEMSLETAKYLETGGIKAKYIDIDLNPDPKYKSNTVLRAALGLIESYGYVARYKPNAISASSVADWICH